VAPKAVARLGGEGAEAKGPVGDVAVDGVAAGRRQAEAPWAATACAKGAYLKAAEPTPPLGLVDQHRFQPRQRRRCRPHRRLAQNAGKEKPARSVSDRTPDLQRSRPRPLPSCCRYLDAFPSLRHGLETSVLGVSRLDLRVPFHLRGFRHQAGLRLAPVRSIGAFCACRRVISKSYITYITGIALETLAGVLSLADSDMDQYKIEVVKNDIVKLFDSIKSYDDGTLYFDEKRIGDTESRGPLATTASVVHGVTAFAAIVSGKLKVSEQNVLKLFLFLLC
ncbi:hypothetical protein B296_00020692, partial [Ensete ventricosum]